MATHFIAAFPYRDVASGDNCHMVIIKGILFQTVVWFYVLEKEAPICGSKAERRSSSTCSSLE